MQKTINIWEGQPHVPLTSYRAQGAGETQPAMLICPGGAYREHAVHEGHGYATWLTAHGIHCFVLAYRLGSQGHRFPRPFEDVVRAMRLIRHNAATWGVDPTRIGVMGSSAGGHLASTLLTRFDGGIASSADPVDRVSSRPDLGILCYPVISMRKDPHAASRANLLGDPADEGLIELLSNENHVTADVPPCFLWHTFADSSVSVSHSLAFATALQAKSVPFELHTFERGGHGLGLNTTHPWPHNCLKWLAIHGFVSF